MFTWLKKRRLRVGKEFVRWPMMDVRDDRLVVDLSRLEENLVGIWRRRYNVLQRGKKLPPPYPDEIEYVHVRDL